MMNRRKYMTISAAAAAASVSAFESFAKDFGGDFEPRGTDRIFERLASLNRESELDFYTGYRVWIQTDLKEAAQKRAREIFRENGISPYADVPMDQVVRLMEVDPIMAYNIHAWETTQIAMWRSIQNEYHKHADMYLDELEAAEKLGSGTIQLRPDMHIPEYTTYEIHLQPGGYVGDPFAGYIYNHGENVVFHGGNYQDDAQVRLASAVPLPEDGKVKRILEQACSSGQFTAALKTRFRDAEVWGDDIGAPMLRYAHMRSVELGLETHYVQQLSEESQLPDNHFDIVTNNLLFHEVPEDAAEGIISEGFRQLRPGGIYYPVDLFTANPPNRTAYGKYWAWRDYRWNAEVWRMDYMNLDMAAVMKKVGFIVDENGPPARRGARRNIIGIKPA